jgi:putative ABC transport system substrate-binding protein
MPLLARAQPAKIPTVGVLTLGRTAQAFQEALRQGLRDLGYVEGKNIIVEWRTAEVQGDRANALAQELVRLKVDVIVAAPTQAVQVVKGATSSIPIVMLSAEPVNSGFVASLARPGGNITGLSTMVAELGPKLLELAKELQPSVSRIAVLTRPSDTLGALILAQIQPAADRLRIKVQPVFARAPADLDGVFSAMVKERAGAVIIQPSLATQRVAELALKHRILSVTTGIGSTFPELGGLAAYGVNSVNAFRQTAVFVDRILKGAKPADIPVEQPTGFELAINRKTAKALGITIPQSLLVRTDRVVD